jgi:hypothetical protein
MTEWLAFVQYALYFAVLLFSLSSVYFSFRSRKAASNRMRGIYAARMNICMGIMLVLISVTQLLLFNTSYVRMGVGVVFLLLGLFNLFAGLRNHGIFSRLSE